MSTTGMNLAEVRHLGQQLDAGAKTLREVIASVDGRVHSTTWFGPDADRFRHWWPGHRQLLLQAADRIHGLAQSAKNNADEQERVSGTGSAPAAGPGGGLSPALLAAVGTIGGAASGTLPALLRAAQGNDPVATARALAAYLRDPNVTLSAKQGVERVFAAHSSGSAQWGVVPAQYYAEAQMYARLQATESLTLDKNGLAAIATAGALVGVSASASGSLGNQYLGAGGAVRAGAEAGAQGTAALRIDPHGQATASLDGKFGAYAKVAAEADVHAAGVHAGGTAQAEAGFEAHAGVTGAVGKDEVKAHVSIGAAAFVGAGVAFDVDVRPAETMATARHAVTNWTKGLHL